MASFAYTKYLQQVQAGTLAVPISSWISLNLALVLSTYAPAKNTDTTLADIPSPSIAADGMTGTFPTFTWAVNGTGAGAAETGIRTVALLTNKWAAVALAASPVNALVLYAVTDVGLDTLLLAYFDNWGGLGFTPNGTDVTLNSFPTPDVSGGVNLLRLTN